MKDNTITFCILIFLIFFLTGCDGSNSSGDDNDSAVKEYDDTVTITGENPFMSAQLHEVNETGEYNQCEEVFSRLYNETFIKIESPDHLELVETCFDLGTITIDFDHSDIDLNKDYYLTTVWGNSGGHHFEGFEIVVESNKIFIIGNFSYCSDGIYTCDMAPYYALVEGSPSPN